MRTKLEKLTAIARGLYIHYKNEINKYPRSGPRGGNNAACDWAKPYWRHLGNAAITRACNEAGVPTMPYWSGSATTPATSIPACMAEGMERAYRKIMGRKS